MSHMNASCHISMSHVTYEWITPRRRTRHISNTNGAHTCVSHVPHMNDACPTYKWVMSRIWMSHVAQQRFRCFYRGMQAYARRLKSSKSPRPLPLPPRNKRRKSQKRTRSLSPKQRGKKTKSKHELTLTAKLTRRWSRGQTKWKRSRSSIWKCNKSSLSTRYCRDLTKNLCVYGKRAIKETSIYGERHVKKKQQQVESEHKVLQRSEKKRIHVWKKIHKRDFYLSRKTRKQNAATWIWVQGIAEIWKENYTYMYRKRPTKETSIYGERDV